MTVTEENHSALALPKLVSNGTLDWKAVAFLWLALERHRSIIVAAEPRLAGKTTLLHAMMELVAPIYSFVATRGRKEDFGHLLDHCPKETYIVVNELSDHLETYLWGPPVGMLFRLVARGYAFVATMHAEAPMGVVRELLAPQLTLSHADVANVDLIVMLELETESRELVRRVMSINTLEVTADESVSIVATPLMVRKFSQGSLEVVSGGLAWAVIARRLALPESVVHEEIAARADLLPRLLQGEIVDSMSVRRVMEQHYRLHPPMQ